MRLWDAMIVEICFTNIKTNFGFGILVVSFHILVVPAVFVPSRSFSFLIFLSQHLLSLYYFPFNLFIYVLSFIFTDERFIFIE